MAVGRRQLDMHRLVASQAVDQRNPETVQNPMPESDGSAGVRRLITL
jgi:hypothetical protein